MKNAEVLINHLSHMLLPVTEYVIETVRWRSCKSLLKRCLQLLNADCTSAEAQGSGKPIQQVPSFLKGMERVKESVLLYL